MGAAKDHWNRLRGQDPSSHSISCGGGLLLRASFLRRYFPARYNFLAVLQIKRIYEAPQPSDGHHPKRWPEFQKPYRQELRDKRELTARIKQLENEHRVVTLVFSARDEERNQAVVWRDFLAKRPRKSERRRADKRERRRAHRNARG